MTEPLKKPDPIKNSWRLEGPVRVTLEGANGTIVLNALRATHLEIESKVEEVPGIGSPEDGLYVPPRLRVSRGWASLRGEMMMSDEDGIMYTLYDPESWRQLKDPGAGEEGDD